MSDMPPMDVALISTADAPAGIGEADVPAVAPAIANAWRSQEALAAPADDARPVKQALG